MSWVEDFIAVGQERAARISEQVRRDSASLYNALTGAGGTGDKGAASRPNPFVVPLSPAEIESLWDNNGIARRLLTLVPERATRKGWDISHFPEEEGKRLRLQSNVFEGMIWGRMYGGAVMLMVTEDDVPSAFAGREKDWLAQPLDLRRVGKLHALQVFDAYDCTPRRWDEDLRNNNYRRPLTWDINAEGISAEVHHSRVVYFPGARRPPSWRRRGYRTWHSMPDVSWFQFLWDNLRAYTDTIQGGATLAQELRQHVLRLSSLKASSGQKARESVKDYLRGFVQNLSTHGIAVIGPEDEYTQAQAPPSGFLELTDAMKEALAACSGIHQVVFWGDTPSGLNTDGDSAWEGFRQLVATTQANELKPGLEQVTQVAFAAQDGPTRGEIPPDSQVKFRSLAEPSDQQAAVLRESVANHDERMVQMGVFTPSVIARHRYGPDGYRAEPPELTEDELAEVEFETEQRALQRQMMAQDPMMGEGEEEEPDGGNTPELPPPY